MPTSMIISRPTLKGDFDGKSFFGGAGLLLLVPEVEPGLGFGMILAGKRRMRPGTNGLGMDLYLVRSGFKAKWEGVPGDGVLWDVGAGISYHIMTNRRIQPYCRGSMGFTNFDFDVADSLDLETTPFAGMKWAVGLGVSAYLNHRWCLDLGLYRNNLKFGSPVDRRSIQLDPPIRSRTVDIESRVSYLF